MAEEFLVITHNPAPYRVSLFNEIARGHDMSVLFEHKIQDTRVADWYRGNSYGFKTYFLGFGKGEIREAIRLLMRSRYFIFYEYSTVFSSLAIILAILRRKKYIINVDGIVQDSGNPLKNSVKRFFLRRADFCMAGSDSAQEYFLKYGVLNERIVKIFFTSIFRSEILGQPLVDDEKSAIRKKYDIPFDKIVITIGRFIPLKNIESVISRWDGMDKDLALLVVGGGELHGEYERIIAERGLKNVIVLGFKTREELFDLMKISLLLVHPSRYDVWGLVINEAMACGLPVITTDRCVAGRELIPKHGNGFVVDLDSPDRFMRCVREIASDDELRSRQAAASLRAIGDYTIERSSSIIRDILRELTDGHE